MNFEDLTDEQKEKARACKTTEELVALAKSEGVDLSDEQLMSLNGGADSLWDYISGCEGDRCIDYD